ncbi:nucleocapsid protein [Yunnan Paris negative-stranded virus]|uniref:Nucleoprotein n=1 Tax=Yunnan Paris negative-stranded virus TaxID=2836142 RepID=A0A8E7DC48_9VIRU|nr:nucleocapsid protein [Yunnan Paris negative-stranded virus]QVU28734.1 nucleocapsid protein [Yunnan Paris negative-stranded virus]
MATSVRSNKTLKEQLREMNNKSGEVYSSWYAALQPTERETVDKIILTTNAAKKAREEAEIVEEQEEEQSTVTQKLPVEISEADISAMWTTIDEADVMSLDQEALKIFEYQGFNPKLILLSLMKAKKKNKISDDIFKSDVLTLCAISIIKGSINSNNIKKISEQGQQEISRLESVYGIKRGSGRKEKPEVITVSRIGATFPGKIIQLICAGKVQGRSFPGPFNSSSLPNFMRHQAFAAVIPRTLSEKTRNFLLTLVIAFSVDQSIQINPNKKEKQDPVTLFGLQSNFINVTHNGVYPPEHTKVQIFKTLLFNYDELMPTARKVSSIMGDLIMPTKDEFNSSLALLE